MRHKGSRNVMKEQQDAHIIRTFALVLQKHGGKCSVATLYRLIAAQPAPRFFITEREAVRLVRQYAYNTPLRHATRPARLRMAGEIARRIIEQHGALPTQQRALAHAVRNVIASPAPEAYIETRQIAHIICTYRRNNAERYISRRQQHSRPPYSAPL